MIWWQKTAGVERNKVVRVEYASSSIGKLEGPLQWKPFCKVLRTGSKVAIPHRSANQFKTKQEEGKGRADTEKASYKYAVLVFRQKTCT
jgi:hypothetical protein